MHRIGRIVGYREGHALVELGLSEDYTGASCARCREAAGGRPVVEVEWSGPWLTGEKVRVRAVDGYHRAFRWLVFLAAFAATLGLAVRIAPAAAADGPAGRTAVLIALAAGTVAWAAARWGTGKMHGYRATPLGERPGGPG